MASRTPRSAAAAAPPPGSVTTTFVPPAPPAQDEDDFSDRAPSFWEMISAIPPAEWWSGNQGEKGYKVYLYRDSPRAQTKGSAYKRLITEPFDVEWVKQQLGGYDYRAMLNDPSGRMTSYTSFSIDAPPKETGEPAPAPAAAADPLAGGGGILAQFVQVMRESQAETRQLLREIIERDRNPGQAGALDPNEALKGVVTIFAAAAGRNQGPSLGDLIGLVKQLTPATPDFLHILAQAREAGLISGAAAGGGNLLDQVDQLLSVAEKLGGKAGREPGLAETLVNKAPELLGGIGTIITKAAELEKTRLQTAQTIRSTRPAAAPGPAAPGAPQIIAPPRAPAIPPPAPGGAVLEAEPIGAAAPPAADANLDLLRQYIVNAIQRNVDGADIVGFIQVSSPDLLEGLMSLPPDQVAPTIQNFFASDPILKTATQLPNFQRCLAEMIEAILPPPADEPEPAETLH
jgi:hypothetical protein